MADQEQEDIQRWTTKRKVALVVSIIKGETSIQEAARQHGITVAEIEDWKERFRICAMLHVSRSSLSRNRGSTTLSATANTS
jgi:hypothetical protein